MGLTFLITSLFALILVLLQSHSLSEIHGIDPLFTQPINIRFHNSQNLILNREAPTPTQNHSQTIMCPRRAKQLKPITIPELCGIVIVIVSIALVCGPYIWGKDQIDTLRYRRREAKARRIKRSTQGEYQQTTVGRVAKKVKGEIRGQVEMVEKFIQEKEIKEI